MASGQDPTKAAMILFGEELRAARTRAGMTIEQLGEAIRYSASLIRKIERGERPPSADFAAMCDQVFNTTGTFARMEARMRDLVFPEAFRPFRPFESAATALRTWHHSLIPGILQTADYARAVFATRQDTTEDEAEDLVRGRMDRQEVLDRETPPVLWVLIDEGALARPVASCDVMREQVRHLIDMAQRPRVTIQIVPLRAGGHTGLLGAFTLAETDDGSTVAYVEDAADGRVAHDPETVSKLRHRFDSLRSEALDRTASLALMEKVAKEL
jgi:transcriptional regulator with XRE-family HTH domain